MADGSDLPDSSEDRSRTVTHLLREAQSGGPQRAEELLPVVYDELRALAAARLAHEAHGRAVDATGLVHEAYLRLVGDEDPGWNGKGHFFGAAALAMRRILVDQARRRGRIKRGGDRKQVTLHDVLAPQPESPVVDVLAVDEAVRRLEAEDPRKGRIVNLRYFAGLTNEQIASVLDVSVGTVERDWRFIRAWLLAELDRQS